jgi:hypothetical protein
MARGMEQGEHGVAADVPGRAFGVDDVEVIGIGDDVELDVIALAAGVVGPALGELRRDLIVVGALDKDLGDAERKQQARVGGGVAVWVFSWAASHKGADGGAAVVEAEDAAEGEDESEIDCAGEGDEAFERKIGLWRGEYAGVRDVVAAGQPEGKLASGGVAGGENVADVEGEGLGEFWHEVHAGGGVLEGAWPATAGVADAAVLDGPDGCALGRHGLAEKAGVVEVEGVAPPSAVEEDDERVELIWLAARRQPQVAELEREVAVGETIVGAWWCAVEEVHADAEGTSFD